MQVNPSNSRILDKQLIIPKQLLNYQLGIIHFALLRLLLLHLLGSLLPYYTY